MIAQLAMAALPPKAAVKLILGKGAANDPKGTSKNITFESKVGFLVLIEERRMLQ